MRILISAGELSGSIHAAKLVAAWRKRDLKTKFYGMGGASMAKAGVKLVVNSDHQFGIMGLSGIFKKFRKLFSAFIALAKLLSCQPPSARPDWLILVDYGGFNLPLAYIARRHNVKVCYYIPPKTWASRAWRLRLLRRLVNLVAVIFPFEVAYFNQHHIKAYYVGNPTFEATKILSQQQRNINFNISDINPLSIALMPGSRTNEVARLLPVMLKAMINFPNAKLYLAPAPTIAPTQLQAILKNFPQLKITLLQPGDLSMVYQNCHLAIVASGTATLELAMLGVPAIVVYRLGWIEYFLAKALIKIPYVALTNILLNKMLVKELLQGDCQPQKIQQEIMNLMQPARLEEIQAGYQQLYNQLSSKDVDLIDLLTNFKA